MPVQVNTLVAAETADDMPAIYELLKPFTHRALEPVLPHLRGARQSACSRCRRRKAKKLMRLDSRHVADCAVYRRHHGSAVISQSRARENARRRHDRRADPEKRRYSQLRHPRRPRHHVRVQHRRYLPGGFSAVAGGQCPQGSHCRRCTAILRCSASFTILRSSRTAAACAITGRCAEARVPVLLRRPGIRSRPIRSACSIPAKQSELNRTYSGAFFRLTLASG